MAEAVIILFHDDGTVSVGRTKEVACLHMTRFQHSLWRPAETLLMEKVQAELEKVKRMKR